MPLWLCLSLLLAACVLFKAKSPAMATAALLLNWCVCTVLTEATRYQFHYMMLAAVDTITAAAILLLPLSKGQVLLAVTYVAALCAHAFFAVVGPNPTSEYQYWWSMHYIAWTQLWLALAWGSFDAGRRIINRGDHRHRVDVAHHMLHPLAGVSMREGNES